MERKASEEQIKLIKALITEAAKKLNSTPQEIMRSLAYNFGKWVRDFSSYTVGDAIVVIEALKAMSRVPKIVSMAEVVKVEEVDRGFYLGPGVFYVGREGIVKENSL